MSAEQDRLAINTTSKNPWKKWGPYLSERQWGTVREDYSDNGNAWGYFSHDQARSRAYRWGEDGIAGISDNKQRLCFSLALWNGKDPILKERLFGLTNAEGNHGEDVKEYYFYVDSTPTHSYMKYLYKYPQNEFPYDNLVATNGARSRTEYEYELLDTGIFKDNRYFDVFVEYAKASPDDMLVQISIHNRGPEDATLHVLPTLLFRNEWSWNSAVKKPAMREGASVANCSVVATELDGLGQNFLYCSNTPPLLFTENETNNERLFSSTNATPYVKDAFHNYLIKSDTSAVNPQKSGTKVSPHYVVHVKAGGCEVVKLRLSNTPPSEFASRTNQGLFGTAFDEILSTRLKEADEFYKTVIPASLNADQNNVVRQALAGMMWGKQFFNYDVDKWLEERGSDPFCPNRKPAARNNHWHHMYNHDIISMPDKWEYPWYAAWDLAFHVLSLSMVDYDFAKNQLNLMLKENYLHPNGQIPAYEWNFGDVNPPVHAWATIFLYRLEKAKKGKGDTAWLETSFQKLLMNFTWWVNRKDRSGKNAFEGGFLGLDNIGVFDRSSPLPTGGYLEQADGTAWMALYSQNMLEIAVELALEKPSYAEIVQKFCQHYTWIASAMMHGMWDEEDGFFYDVLCTPDGGNRRLKVRSMVGLLPLCAGTVFHGEFGAMYPDTLEAFGKFVAARKDLFSFIHDSSKPGVNGRRLASILNETKLRRVLSKMLDPDEFLSDFGIRSLSRYHEKHPYVVHVSGNEYSVNYLPAESDTGMFGGNSNWRGPIWMPVNILIIRALLSYYTYYGNDFKVECPVGSGKFMNLYEVSEEIARRLATIFLKDKDGKRPVYGGTDTFQNDPHWRDYMQFYEYFHADNGAGLGANHQTGWTGILARTMHLFATTTAEQLLDTGRVHKA